MGFGLPEVAVPDWEANWSIRGIGFDDHPSIFSRLPTKISYTNTHLDRYPQLDLRSIPPVAEGSLSFVLCSDVLEHVVPPVKQAVRGIKQLLSSGGIAVISVPVGPDPGALTDEYYPGLVDFKVQKDNQVEWTDADGRKHLDVEPEFHGGTGLVLSFRTFGAEAFSDDLRQVGFKDVQELPPCPSLGVFDLQNHGVFLARA